jgi:hypothetical protein
MVARNSRGLVVVVAAIVVGLVVAWNIRQALLLIYVSAVFAVVLKPAIDRLHRTSLFGSGRGSRIQLPASHCGAIAVDQRRRPGAQGQERRPGRSAAS